MDFSELAGMRPTAADYISLESACENPAMAHHVVVSHPITAAQRETIPAMRALQTLVLEFEGELTLTQLAGFSELPGLWSLEIRVDRLAFPPKGNAELSFGQLTELILSVQEACPSEGCIHLITSNPLQNLDLRCDSLDDQKSVGEAIQACKSLSSLQLYRPDDAMLFALCGMTQLETLRVESGSFGDGSLRALCMTCKGLKNLQIGATATISNAGMIYLTSLENLQEFALHECPVDANVFLQLSAIRSLENIDIGLEMIPSTIPTGLHIDWPALRELNILAFPCPRDFAEQVLKLPRIQDLGIRGDLPKQNLLQVWQGRTLNGLGLQWDSPQGIRFSADAAGLAVNNLVLGNALISEADIALIAGFQGLTFLKFLDCIFEGDFTPLLQLPDLRWLTLPKSLKIAENEARCNGFPSLKVRWS
jgi:hypothetical protein